MRKQILALLLVLIGIQVWSFRSNADVVKCLDVHSERNSGNFPPARLLNLGGLGPNDRVESHVRAKMSVFDPSRLTALSSRYSISFEVEGLNLKKEENKIEAHLKIIGTMRQVILVLGELLSETNNPIASDFDFIFIEPLARSQEKVVTKISQGQSADPILDPIAEFTNIVNVEFKSSFSKQTRPLLIAALPERLLEGDALKAECRESLETLNLRNRSYQALHLSNIRTIGDLLRIPFRDLWRTPNLGEVSLIDIVTALARRSLVLGMEIPE